MRRDLPGEAEADCAQQALLAGLERLGIALSVATHAAPGALMASWERSTRGAGKTRALSVVALRPVTGTAV